MGPGMMGPSSMMGPAMMSGMPMMGGMMGYYSGVPTSLYHDDAKAIAGEYLASMNNPDLRIDEFEEYSHNFYVSLIEESAGRGAIEIIIDRYSGSLQPEPQSMMWNTKYGMMGSSYAVTAEMPVTPEQAKTLAQRFLDVNLPGVTVGEADIFYGYYTLHTLRDGQIEGMLSVNGYKGGVWYHDWHGPFIGMKESHEGNEGGHSD